MENPVQHNLHLRRFEIRIANDVALLEYQDQGPTLILTHTFVPPALRGKGLAAILVRDALDFARKEGKRVNPQCSYAAAYLDRHPEYHDLRG